MKITYLGTAAAEGIPALFCECETCKKARQIKGKNIRTRSQLLINDDLLIDYPPDSFYHFFSNNIDLSKIKNILITHTHEDHFYPLDFGYLVDHTSHPNEDYVLNVYGNNDINKSLDPFMNHPNRANHLSYTNIEPFKTYEIGKYKVTPLKAFHGTNNPYIYIVSDGIKTILYAHDTGIFLDETFKYLIDNKIHLDLVSLDCTKANQVNMLSYDRHMSFETNKIVINKLKENNLIDNKTILVLNHFSHNGINVLYDEFSSIVKDEGYIVSYDGMKLEI